ncbi:MAG TPA: DUF6101 family protein [Pseudolabrys sp.]|nr:DUF6101 family protein [Pseudolabrys sp.]
MRSGGCPAGSGRALRLDPFALPVRYAAGDAAADGGSREIELTRDRVVVRRQLAGMRMALNLPVGAFAGVGLRLTANEAAVVLAHQDPGLALPLFLSDEPDDVTAAWRSWGAVLGLPLLVEDEDGWREPFDYVGSLRVARPCPRRRRRSALKRRRPSILMRRERGVLTAAAPIHRGEAEIIARN